MGIFDGIIDHNVQSNSVEDYLNVKITFDSIQKRDRYHSFVNKVFEGINDDKKHPFKLTPIAEQAIGQNQGRPQVEMNNFTYADHLYLGGHALVALFLDEFGKKKNEKGRMSDCFRRI